MNPRALLLTLCLVAGHAAAQTAAGKEPEVKLAGPSRVTPQRPTALPENKELADRFGLVRGRLRHPDPGPPGRQEGGSPPTGSPVELALVQRHRFV